MARKHFTQFSADESGFIHGFIRKRVQPLVHGSAHFYDRAGDRHITLADAAETLRTGSVIEIHNDRGEWRALVRSRIGTCVVVSLESNLVLTVYYNNPTDNHETLNHSLYQGGKAIDAVAVIKNLVQQRRQRT